MEHGKLMPEAGETDFKCRFCDRHATVWVKIPIGKGKDDFEFETFCDNHAQELGYALLQDSETQ